MKTQCSGVWELYLLPTQFFCKSMEQQTDSKYEKEHIKAVYWHLAYLPAGSTHSSTRGLRAPEQLERPAGFYKAQISGV